MVKSCCAVNCTLRCVPRSKLSFYRFPPEGTELRKRWVQAIRRVGNRLSTATSALVISFRASNRKIHFRSITFLVSLHSRLALRRPPIGERPFIRVSRLMYRSSSAQRRFATEGGESEASRTKRACFHPFQSGC